MQILVKIFNDWTYSSHLKSWSIGLRDHTKAGREGVNLMQRQLKQMCPVLSSLPSGQLERASFLPFQSSRYLRLASSRLLCHRWDILERKCWFWPYFSFVSIFSRRQTWERLKWSKQTFILSDITPRKVTQSGCNPYAYTKRLSATC